MLKLKFYQLYYFLGALSCFVFFALTLSLLSPTITTSANAEDLTQASSVEYRVAVEPVLSIALDQNVQTSFDDVTTGGAYQNSVANLVISTNSTNGYAISMTPADNDNNLKNYVSNSIIPSITSTTSANNLPNDTWGYSLVKAGDTLTNYYAIPSTTTEIKKVDTGVVSEGITDSYTLNFGTKISTKTPSGVYGKQLAISVVANPVELKTLTDITTMQEMNSWICDNTPVEPIAGSTKQLKDARDNKLYWVTKLKDGNCWMTQNLALDIPATGLKAADTDITTDWNQSSQYPPSVTNTTFNFNLGSASTTTNSWNVGEYVLVNPTEGSPCGNGSITSASELSGCNRTQSWNGTQDAHYLIGNYYQWNTATAGTGGNNVSVGINGSTSATPWNAPGSICPKGWQLPQSEMNTGNFDAKYGKTFYKLFNAYGYSFSGSGGANLSGAVGQNSYNTATNPWYFVRSGYVINRESGGSIENLGHDSLTWASTAYFNSTNAYDFNFNSTNVQPSNFRSRGTGFSVRCLAR